MNMSPPAPARLRSTGARIALVAAAALLLWAFDWTWFRPLIQYGVAERSGRRVDFDELHIGLTRSLDPIVQLRGLLIQNASWAASRPLVRAGLVSFTFSWRALFADQIVVTRLVLVDADVDLERQADGLRNWRLIHPDDRGPQRIKVLAVDATRSAVRVLHRGIDLEVDVRASALQPVQAIATHPELPLTKWLVFKGAFGGKAFEGQTAVSDVIAFGDAVSPFAVRGKAQIGGSRVEAEGVASGIRSSADFDLDVRLSAASLAELWPWPIGNASQHSPPAVSEGHVRKAGSKWTVSRLKAKVGHTDLSGDATFDDGRAAGHRPNFQASLLSTVFDLEDIAPLTGMGSKSAGDAARLREFDAEMNLRIMKFDPAVFDVAQSLQMHAVLRDGVMALKPFDLGAAGGHVIGGLQIDASHAPVQVALDLQARGLLLGALSSALPETRRLNGAVDGRVSMRSQGESFAALVDAATGSLSAALSGATVSNRLDAEMGLDGSGLLRTLFTADRRVPVQCATLAVDFLHGAGKIRHLALETQRTALNGGGSVDLVHKSFDVTVMPKRKQGSLLALNKAIHVQGSLRDTRVELVDPVAQSALDNCRHSPQSSQKTSP